MKVTEIIRQRKGKPFPSLEFVPPLKGRDINQLYSALEPLMEFRPPFMNLTCHRDERSDGRVVSKRPGTVAIAAAVMKRFPVEVIPHLLCAYATADELENELLDLSFLDIENVMALRGDTSGEGPFKAEKGGYRHCSQLVSQIARMNRGIYLDDDIRDAVPTDFCIGVAGYPEKHLEALVANAACRQAIKDYAERGGRIQAECGGMMYLCERIVTDEGEYPMCGVLPYSITARKSDRKLSLGYRQFTLDGKAYRGHEFHYTQFFSEKSGKAERLGETPKSLVQVYNAKGEPVSTPVFRYKNVLASYTHLYQI